MKGTGLEVNQVTITEWGTIAVNQKDEAIAQKPDNQNQTPNS